jgi:hypothetical protein
MQTDPLTIAAYSPDIDNVMLLRLPNTLGDDLNLDLKLGARLVTCNTYGTLAPEFCDIHPGPRASGAWTNCNCVVGDLVTDDRDRLMKLKNSFPEEAWEKCREYAAERISQNHPCRDGRPNYSWIPIAYQKLPPFRVRGGYCK